MAQQARKKPGKKCRYKGYEMKCKYCNRMAPKCTEEDEKGNIVHQYNRRRTGEAKRHCVKCGRVGNESGFMKRKRETDPEKRKRLKEGTDEDARAKRRKAENDTDAQKARKKEWNDGRTAKKDAK